MEKSKVSWKIYFIFLFLAAAFAGLLARCFYLQYLRGGEYVERSFRIQRKLMSQTSQRGPILDCLARPLAASKKINIVFAEPRVIEYPKQVANELQPILGVGAHEICRKINQSRNPGYVKLAVDVDTETCSKAAQIYGIGIEKQWRREYPMGELVSHVTGYANSAGEGLEGIELGYDKILAGTSGKDILLADIRRRPIRLMQNQERLSDGDRIILTIDATIQQFVREELVKVRDKYQAESAIGIVADPWTGAILAMVSLPDYNPNSYITEDMGIFRNRAITDQFEPGSIIKPVIAAIALDAGVVNTSEKIFCEDGFYHGKGFGSIKEYNYHQYGSLTVKDILVHSSNIGMAKVGQKLGQKRLYNGIRLFGFGTKSGIDLPGEVGGLVWPVSKWTGYSVTRIPFGQEITVTGIQLVRAFCILANGGRNVKPHVVKAIVDSDGKIKKIHSNFSSVGYVIKPEVAN
ncbi:MAG: penicillin-binding protein 2, partial [Planctomycetes bacterium]|nr:penicillin-binding protein 2 [Planctomycetota bacterium]